MSAQLAIWTSIAVGIGLGILAIFFGVMRLRRRGNPSGRCPKVRKATTGETTFELRDLVITPLRAREGEKVNISFRVTNVSDTPVLVGRAVKVNGVEIGRVDLELAPGESKPVSFVVQEHAPGEYRVEVGDMTGSFVISPPELRVEAMDINPRRAREGGKVEIAARIANAGGSVGRARLEVKLRGTALASREIAVPAGESEQVNIGLSDLEAGIYEVRIGDFRDSFVVEMSDSFETL